MADPAETDDAFWARLLGDGDPGAPDKDWVSAAFTENHINLSLLPATTTEEARDA